MAQFTKRAIMDTFLDLLEEMSFDKITVKTIVDRCNINRGTFYYYYTDIYALLEDVFDSEAQTIIDAHKDYDSWQQAFLEGTQLARQSRKQLYHAVHTNNKDKMEQLLYSITHRMMLDFIQMQAKGLHVSDMDMDFIAEFYSCALTGLIAKWLSDNMKTDPEIYINKLGILFEGNIRKALERAAAHS